MLNIKPEFKSAEAAEGGFTVEIFSPAGGALGLKINVLGADSHTYKKAERTMIQRRITKKVKKVNLEEMEKEAISLLAKCTTGWSGTECLTADGSPIPFEVEFVQALYTDCPWVKEQVEEAMGDRANFLSN